MEGHPVVQDNGVNRNVPVTSAYQYFGITDATPAPRREVVDINKCKVCHTGIAGRDGSVIPRLSLHGGNRTEEPKVCTVCHNPNQTDIPFRTAGAEESVDFKRMVHGIHAGRMRRNPLVIIGRNGSINDYSGIRFPGKLKDCVRCHIDGPRGGTFSLPLQPGVLGSTVDTGSIPGVLVDVDPANDLKITPTASVCSSCHDSRSAVSHMIQRGGASFSALPSQIASGAVRERCVDCHGPGRDKDVRKVHSIDAYGED
jgi:OmcA/MtrC family decaheme c-type cytochrome